MNRNSPTKLENTVRPFAASTGGRIPHFQVVVTPGKLQEKSQELIGTEKVERLGVKVVVTGKERTLRPGTAGLLDTAIQGRRCSEAMESHNSGTGPRPALGGPLMFSAENLNFSAKRSFFVGARRSIFSGMISQDSPWT